MEKPIAFTREMIVRILANAKTQTRRVIRFKHWPESPVVSMMEHFEPFTDSPKNFQRWTADHSDGKGTIYVEQGIKCPYGLIGQKLWVRESFTIDYESFKPYYWADDVPKPAHLNWHSARFMPRWAARIFLEITGVRAERLQDIGLDKNVNDVFEEGIPKAPYCEYVDGELTDINCDEAVDYYKGLWDSMNKVRGLGWDTNPFVWVISFKRIDPIPVIHEEVI